ncbi:hypothetical protein BH10PSE1_BH10PSE1_12690 [soil metagenome]
MTPPRTRSLSRRIALSALAAAARATGLSACTPTIRLQVDPIQINATLDANVRIKLDQELQDLLRENPNLF